MATLASGSVLANARWGYSAVVTVDRGATLRVTTHDDSHFGAPAAEEVSKAPLLCEARRSGTKNTKSVIFKATRVGRTMIDATPRVAPKSGTATEKLRVHVLEK